LIPAPKGLLSKPKAGGYQLNVALEWDRGKYKEVQNTLHDVANVHLNVHFSYEQQTEAARNNYLNSV
ncbi:hypothetical protein OF83DRAFT_1022186, partial [Amylostereum chailletii]